VHEYSIVQALFEQVEALAHERRAASVTRVCVSIGRSAGVDVGLLRTAYDTFRPSTVCERASLEIDEVPERWSCPDGHGDIAPGRRLACDVCGRPARLTSGDEIVLERLELEVP